MKEALAIFELIISHHIPSLLAGLLSAALWIKSATIKSKVTPHRVVVTFGNSDDKVDLHTFLYTAKLQAKYNSRAAIAAAVAIICQVVGW
ncbi:hypothetical protein ABRP60_18820 [Pectobacterium brasiliense]|uniref:hypothetical protein n=1 Tax=Pectobacterium brasiliense TaxID=180957 RepID=UPI001F2DB62D|nr:hypothetical protein [Pectobacterium brasiliense]